MKLLRAFSLTLTILAGALSLSLIKNVEPKNVEAATQSPGLPSGGNPGSVIFIDGGGTYFNDVDAVLYCWNSTSSAFSAKSSYRVNGTDKIAVRLPSGGTWTHFKVLRYNRSMEPSINAWDGVYNQSPNYGFGETFQYYQNSFGIKNWNMEITDRYVTSYTHYGINGEDRVYLDLSEFENWDSDYAQFAIYFADPMLSIGEAWSSMMTKVEGAGNDHLYECTVPGKNVVWNLAIPVRFKPEVEIPGWHDGVWNQTNDLRFDITNHGYNVLKVTGWDSGEIKSETITREQRVEMYGQYFLDTVSCSGTGLSDSTTSEQWNAVKSQYQNMHTDYQGVVWTTIADSDTSASKVAQAMARYDYIVLYKQYDHEDFINRQASPNMTVYNLAQSRVTFTNENKEASITVIVLVSILSISSISVLLIVKRRKVN